MKKYFLPKDGNFYKSNLHCHTTVSDGKNTPEEIKEIYKNVGYSIVAYTDHDVFIPHNDLTDETFLALNGFEMEIGEPGDAPWHARKTCHICFIALDKDTDVQPMWSDAYVWGNATNYIDKVKFDKTLPPYKRVYSGEGISDIMKIGADSGFFVTYNHPTWSRETYNEYTKYFGMHAFEMFNGGVIAEGFDDYNPRVYEDLLVTGHKIFCIGADDNHIHLPDRPRYSHTGKAFTMIKAEKLDYKSVTDALSRGDFYASEGPEIYELYEEDGKLHITCSEADKIVISFRHRHARVVFAEDDTPLTSATFDLADNCGYFRITVVDKSGKHACTNAYYFE